MQESWYEKLGRWEEALEAYERKQPSVSDPTESIGLVLGRMRCLRALGEWGKLWNLARDAWPDVCDVPKLRKQVHTPPVVCERCARMHARARAPDGV